MIWFAECGKGLLLLGIVSSLVGIVVGLWQPRAWRILRWCQGLALVGALGALALLAAAVIAGDTRLAYAVEHRAPAGVPGGLRLAAVWAGQAGGLLLWCCWESLVALVVSPRTQPRALAVLFVLRGYLFTLIALNTPFAAASATTGGLNPLLLNPMMLIHPPMLFLGYALLTMPFAITLGALLEDAPAGWPARVWPWVLVSWLALTLGNGFGAWWAYKTFGWGGFWGWDPVENSSFVPWMLAAATVHALWLARRDARWRRPAAAYAMGGFIAVLYGSFLSRSGLLAGASVHAYTRGDRLFLWSLGILVVAALLAAAVALGVRWRAWGVQHSFTVSRHMRLAAWGTGLLVAIALLVTAGMSAPIVRVVPSMDLYNAVLLPFGAAMLAALVWPSLRRWLRTPQRIAGAVLGGLFAVIWAIAFVALDIPPQSALTQVPQTLFAPPLILFAVLLIIVTGQRALLRRDASHASLVAHLGMALLLLGAAVSGYGGSGEEQLLEVGKPLAVAGHRLNIIDVSTPTPALSRATLTVDGQAGRVEVEDNQSFRIRLRRAWIDHRLWGDLYVAPYGIYPAPTTIEGQAIPAGVLLAFTTKPGISLVWAGMGCMALGILLALVRRIREFRGEARAATPSTAPQRQIS